MSDLFVTTLSGLQRLPECERVAVASRVQARRGESGDSFVSAPLGVYSAAPLIPVHAESSTSSLHAVLTDTVFTIETAERLRVFEIAAQNEEVLSGVDAAHLFVEEMRMQRARLRMADAVAREERWNVNLGKRVAGAQPAVAYTLHPTGETFKSGVVRALLCEEGLCDPLHQRPTTQGLRGLFSFGAGPPRRSVLDHAVVNEEGHIQWVHHTESRDLLQEVVMEGEEDVGAPEPYFDEDGVPPGGDAQECSLDEAVLAVGSGPPAGRMAVHANYQAECEIDLPASWTRAGVAGDSRALLVLVWALLHDEARAEELEEQYRKQARLHTQRGPDLFGLEDLDKDDEPAAEREEGSETDVRCLGGHALVTVSGDLVVSHGSPVAAVLCHFDIEYRSFAAFSRVPAASARQLVGALAPVCPRELYLCMTHRSGLAWSTVLESVGMEESHGVAEVALSGVRCSEKVQRMVHALQDLIETRASTV